VLVKAVQDPEYVITLGVQGGPKRLGLGFFCHVGLRPLVVSGGASLELNHQWATD